MIDGLFDTADRTLIQAFLDGAARNPDAPLTVSSALRPGNHRLEDVVADGIRFATGLRARGVGAGDIVAVQLPAWSEWMVALIERCAARGLNTFRCYGSSEHPTVTIGDPSDAMDKRLTTEGKLMVGCEMRFVDDDGNDVAPGADGEMVTRGPELFTGYFDPRLDAAAMLTGGWYRTGDIGHFDVDGFLVISDRKKDIIIRGGENIASREVEEVLLTDPTIADAAVVAWPDERMGEVV